LGGVRENDDPLHGGRRLRTPGKRRGEERQGEEGGDGHPRHAHLPMPGCYGGRRGGVNGGARGATRGPGWASRVDDGVRKVAAGRTTLEEVVRVASPPAAGEVH
jgi:hypothetical protein